jgi:RHS repeat-associated protein
VRLPDASRIEYVIDPAGHRVGRRVNGVLTQGFLYDNSARIVAELSPTGAVLSRFVYAGDGGAPAYMERNGVRYRIISDHIGSVRLVVDAATGVVAQRIDYDEYGRVLADSAPGFQPFGYAGGLLDPQTGLVRFGARDYDPATGRFTTKDPLLFGSRGQNVYAYVGGDPINNVDPTGFAACPKVPHAPNRAKIDRNIQEAENHAGDNVVSKYTWFYQTVKSGGRWDYKLDSPRKGEYERFGNFNYGATGYEAGISEDVLLRAAGAAQIKDGTSNWNFVNADEMYLYDYSGWGMPTDGPPYGDDPRDQFWIKKGIEYAKNKCKCEM